MADNPYTTINVRVTPEIKRALQTLAHEYRMGFSDMVREMLEQAVPKWAVALKEAELERTPK